MNIVKKLAVIVVYFGKFPKYMHYFLQSASYNRELNFKIFTDDDYSCYASYENVEFIAMNLVVFNELVSKKMKFTVAIKNSYKLCDFKPMYGFIFNDYISIYSHWAHCDVDIIFGNIANYLIRNSLYDYDIVSSHGLYISGAFTMYKNTEYVNNIFTLSKDYKKVICDEKYLSFDEASTVISKLWDGYDIFTFPSAIESMSHIVKNLKNNLKAYFGKFIEERIKDKITWSEGRLYDGNNEIIIFHYLVYKEKINFNVPDFKNDLTYTFTTNGFFTKKLGSYTHAWVSSIYRNFAGKVKAKVRRKRKSFTL